MLRRNGSESGVTEVRRKPRVLRVVREESDAGRDFPLITSISLYNKNVKIILIFD